MLQLAGQGRRALEPHLCFGAGHLVAVTLPMGLFDPAAGAVAPLQPGLLWHHVLAMQDDWTAAKVDAREGETNTKKGICHLDSDKGSRVCGASGKIRL